MGIPAKYWIELGEELKPFVTKCKEGDITFPEYLEIESQKYNEFIEKYSSFLDNYEEYKLRDAMISRSITKNYNVLKRLSES